MQPSGSGKILMQCIDMFADSNHSLVVPEVSLDEAREFAKTKGWPEQDPQLTAGCVASRQHLLA